MKNYNIDGQSSDKFILGYKINGSDMVIKYTGGTEVIPLSNISEDEILNRMEKQATIGISRKEIIKKATITNVIKSALLIALATAQVLSLNYELLAMLPSLSEAFPVFCGAFSVYYAIEAIKCTLIINDMSKSELLLHNKGQFNYEIKPQTSSSILNNVSQKTVKNIANTPIDKAVFDINSISNYTLRDLKQLKENILLYGDHAIVYKRKVLEKK